MNELWKLAGAFALGIILTVVVVVFLVLPRVRGPLNDTITSIKRSLGTAQELNRQLTDSNKRLAKELNTASDTVAEQKRLIGEQQSEIDHQRRILEDQKQGLGELAQSIQSGGDNLISRAQAIADSFDRLFAIYHKDPSTGASP